MKKDSGYYNEERKEEFLVDNYVEKDDEGKPRTDSVGEYVVSNKRKYGVARNAFRKLADFEEKFGKDFCELERIRDDDFISSIYNKWLSNISENYSLTIHTELRSYVSWCYRKNIITRKQYLMHPFYEKRTALWDYEGGQSRSNSIRIKTQLDCISDSNEDLDRSNYVFPSENELFDYIKTIFADSKNTMYAAVFCLLYYGFASDEIIHIRKDEVDDARSTVRNTVIDNGTAWQMIYKAKYATEFITNNGKHLFYVETPYLIRIFQNISETGTVSINFIKRIFLIEKEAVEELPSGSQYKNVFIKIPLLKTLRVFYQIVQEEKEYGANYVMKKFRNGEYDTAIKYRQYRIMCEKIKR